MVKLVVPCLGDLDLADAPLVRLAEFLGGRCELLPMDSAVCFSENFFEERVADGNSCVVINPAVLSKCFPNQSFPAALAFYLLNRFSFLLVHNLKQDAFTTSTIRALSEGHIHSIQPIAQTGLHYQISPASKEICSHFSGLMFGAADPAKDYVLLENQPDGNLNKLISVDGRALFASMRFHRAEVFFLATADVMDLDSAWDGKPLTDQFSRLLPAAMALRRIFGPACWRPNAPHATLIIDDPLLQRNYGFLNYERVLKLMDEFNFHTSIAFIPHNFQRHSPETVRIFRERPDRYSICFHGNDHTDAEFAKQDAALLNGMLDLAEARMRSNLEKTGIECDKLMVFPQGNFSRTAMAVLKARNFHAAVNTVPCPRGEDLKLSVSDVMQPAVLKYAGFPLFLRKYVRQTAAQEIALNLFFGRPVFLVEHHAIFKNPEPLIDLVSRINAIAPEILWSSVRAAAENSWLARHSQDGTLEIRAYSQVARVENTSDVPQRCSIEWPGHDQSSTVRVLINEAFAETRIDQTVLRADFVLNPAESQSVSLTYRNDFSISKANKQLPWIAKAFLRRRLSELRDNYLSKNPSLLSMAKFVQRHILHKRPETHPEPAGT